MATVSEHSLRLRLARVRALERGATTPGEREAAARARERLEARLVKVRMDDPVARFVAAHVAALGVRPAKSPPPVRLPSERDLLRILTLWERREVSWRKVKAWASRIVDRVVLPTDPDHEGACVSEVLLQLAMMHRVALRPADVPRIRRFLHDRDWSAWFSLLAEAAERPTAVR
jgi:hypothetical protein